MLFTLKRSTRSKCSPTMVCWVHLSATLCLMALSSSWGFSISRIPLAKANLLSIYPSHIIPKRKAELLYVPSPLSRRISNHASSIVEDNHFVSRLSDCGYPIHTLEMPPSECISRTIQSCVMDALTHLQASQTHIVLLGTELSCLNILRVLATSETLKPNNHAQIQGIVLIDPPPLHSVQTEYGRRRILQRFAPPAGLTLPPLVSAVDSAITATGSGVQPGLSVYTDTITVGTADTSHTVSPTPPTEPITSPVPSITEEELAYYDNLVRRQNAGGSRRSVMPLQPPRRSKFSRFLHSLRQRNYSPDTAPPAGELHLSPEEQYERILVALESGMLTTGELLGGDVLAQVGSVREKIGRSGVLVVGTCSASTISDGVGKGGNVRTDVTSIAKAIVNMDVIGRTSADGSADNGTLDVYDEAALFSEADDWGAASMNETARMYSAYPIQYIPPLPDESVSTAVDTDEIVWSQEEKHQNLEIARLVDIFVRNLALQ